MQLTVLCHKDRFDAIKGFRQRHSVGKAEDKTGGAQGVAVYGVWAYDGDLGEVVFHGIASGGRACRPPGIYRVSIIFC